MIRPQCGLVDLIEQNVQHPVMNLLHISQSCFTDADDLYGNLFVNLLVSGSFDLCLERWKVRTVICLRVGLLSRIKVLSRFVGCVVKIEAYFDGTGKGLPCYVFGPTFEK